VDVYKRVIRPLLFKLDPETGHNLSRALLRRHWLVGLFARRNLLVDDARLRVRMGGLTVPNPVGLSAGADKDVDMADSFVLFGFGYVVSGSVMCKVRPGNPKPRLVRDPDRQALYSSMGLPSLGLEYAVRQLTRRKNFNVPLVINFNAETREEYIKAFHRLQPLSDALELSLFCPNRPADAGDFLEPDTVGSLLSELLLHKQKPLFIKVPGYITEADRQKRLALIESFQKLPIDGITITPESRVKENRLAIGQGTLTGPPYYPQMINVVTDFYQITGKNMAIKASGGVVTAEDAFEAIAAGASTVELYTGMIYEGWLIARNINRGLIRLLEKHGIPNLNELRGSGLRTAKV